MGEGLAPYCAPPVRLGLRLGGRTSWRRVEKSIWFSAGGGGNTPAAALQGRRNFPVEDTPSFLSRGVMGVNVGSRSHLEVAVTTKWMSGRRARSWLMTASLPTPEGPEMMITSGGGGLSVGEVLKGPSRSSRSCTAGGEACCDSGTSVAGRLSVACCLLRLLAGRMDTPLPCNCSRCLLAEPARQLRCNAGMSEVGRGCDASLASLPWQRRCSCRSTASLRQSIARRLSAHPARPARRIVARADLSK